MSDELKALSEQVNRLSAQGETLKAEMANIRKEFAAQVSVEAEKQAFAIIKKFSEQFGAPSNGAASAPSAEPVAPVTKPETFEQKVADEFAAQPSERKSKMNAIKTCASKYPQLHAEYRKRVEAGEKIDL